MRVVLGYLLLAISVVLFLSILSFQTADSVLYTSLAAGRVPENIAGAFGVWLATPFVLMYGRWAGLVLVFGFFVLSVNLVVRAKTGRILVKMTLFVISTISLSVVLALLWANAPAAETGLFGLAIGKTLSEWVHPWVVAGFFAALFLVSFFSSIKLFQKIVSGVARVLGIVVLAPFELFGAVMRRDQHRNGETARPEGVFGDETQEERFRMESGGTDGASPVMDIFIPGRGAPEYLGSGSAAPESGGDFGEGAPEPPPGADGRAPDVSRSIRKAPEEGSPAWLSGDREKDEILSSIRHRFDPEFVSVPEEPRTPQAERDAELPVLTEIPSAGEGDAILTEEDLTASAAEAPDNADEKPLKIGNGDEIAGEADYQAERKKRDTRRKKEIPPAGTEPEDESGDGYLFPASGVLQKNFDEYSRSQESSEIESVSAVIQTTFASFRIDVKVSGYSRGPAITRYEIVPPVGLKLKNIVNLTDDLALNLGTRHIRIVAPIGNRSIIGVEVPNRNRRTVVLREIIDSPEFKDSKAKLPLILGKDIAGNIVVEDLAEMPHLLIAGTTGSGKSVYVNSLIGGILFTRPASEVKFIFIDPKMVELELYNGIPNLLAPVITDPEEAIAVLEWASEEVDRRYRLLSENSVRIITDYNQQAKRVNAARRRTKNEDEGMMEVFPYIVIVIDEFANLMLRLPKETEKVISKIAAMARAVGIHLVVATQRPSVDVVTGIIKANFPSRVAFRVASLTDSRTILDKSGAERLLGKGDMLFLTPNFTDMIRIQAPFVANSDVDSLVRELKRNGTADYALDPSELLTRRTQGRDQDYASDFREDPLFNDALRAAVENGEVSASYLQRRFRVGYNRASRMMDALDQMGILGPSTGTSKPREVLMTEQQLKDFLEKPPARP